ncbi:MAG: flippase-like domain-containing protein [Candidatus Thermoplasmatota archaeon]|nr:flippase-like domain-containing protein [Candidatus Thermoplasmatota archaeon]
MPKIEKRKNVRLLIILSIVFSITIIALILYLTIDDQTIIHLTETPINYLFLIAAAGINLIYWSLWGIRLKILSNAIEPTFNISLLKSTKIVIANLFLANITPSMAGGEPVRIYLLNKEGLHIGGATAAVLGERLLDAIVLLLSVPFAFFILSQYIKGGILNTFLYVAVVFFIIVLILFALALKKPLHTKRFVLWIAKKLSRFSRQPEKYTQRVKRISTEIDNFHESMMFFVTKGKKTFFIAGILTIIFWMTGWIIPILILMGLGITPFIIESCAAQILLVIVAMMPTTPGSSGVSEGGTAVLYGIFMPSNLIGVFVLLFRLITYHMGLILGAFFQHRIFKSITSFSAELIQEKQE